MEKKETRIQFVMSKSEAEALDAWRIAQQPPIWSRSEAIRLLIAKGMASAKD